jgi:nickel/cobalt transporter (NicO) family protein
MNNYAELIATSSVLWLVAAAMLLGALHALEPGHSKTMIAAFIVATRGSVAQAVLLGLSAAVSHSLLIWALAAAALIYGNQYISADMEPYLQLVSGIIIIGIGASILVRAQRQAHPIAHHLHEHVHDHHHHDHAPHDAHAAAHARDLAHHLHGRTVSNREVALFGFSGGLMPCPAAFTALLVCMRLKQVTLGFALVLSFSVGLALMLVAIGAVAALGVHHAGKRLPAMPRLAVALPYVSGALILCLGVFMLLSGWSSLA